MKKTTEIYIKQGKQTITIRMPYDWVVLLKQYQQESFPSIFGWDTTSKSYRHEPIEIGCKDVPDFGIINL